MPRGSPWVVSTWLAVAAPAAAANLVVAGEFDAPADVAAWVDIGGHGAMDFDAPDRDGCAASGSARFSALDVAAFEVRFEHCVELPAGAGSGFRLGFELRFESGFGAFAAGVRWYEAAGCAGDPLAADVLGPIGVPAEDWRGFAASTVAPSVAESAAYFLVMYYTTPTLPLEMHVDRVFLRPAADVFDDGFETGATCRWSSEPPEPPAAG